VKSKALVKMKVASMAESSDQIMLIQCLALWKQEVEAMKSKKNAQEKVNNVLGRVYSTAKKQAENATRVMTRQAKERETAVLGEVISVWLCFVADCKKEREFEAAVQQFDMKMKEHLQQRTEEAKSMLDRVSTATQTGLAASVLWAWHCCITEGKKLNGLEKELAQVDAEMQDVKMRQSEAIINAQSRASKLVETSLVVSVLAAWCRETKENRVDKFYAHKVDSKRKQLTAVQTLFKSFARDLEEGLKTVDGDSSGRESTRRARAKQGITLVS